MTHDPLLTHYQLLLKMIACLPPARRAEFRAFLIEAASAAGEDMDVVQAIVADIDCQQRP